MSVNLSGKQFAQSNLIGEVANILEETDLPPDCLKLEITESVVMENIETATEMLQQLRALGLKLSIDDFGTGYSSLSYLHKFPIDTLKIDRSFVTQMAENNENAEIVRTIVVLAQNLGMDVVAEGVETTEQCQLLNALRCENGQGYLFSRPVNAVAAEKFVADAYEGIALLPLLVKVDIMGEIAA
jgi:EAL domain-containing protein (putative c-di-GMP-specific phosphodiesterase class I)